MRLASPATCTTTLMTVLASISLNSRVKWTRHTLPCHHRSPAIAHHRDKPGTSLNPIAGPCSMQAADVFADPHGLGVRLCLPPSVSPADRTNCQLHGAAGLAARRHHFRTCRLWPLWGTLKSTPALRSYILYDCSIFASFEAGSSMALSFVSRRMACSKQELSVRHSGIRQHPGSRQVQTACQTLQTSRMHRLAASRGNTSIRNRTVRVPTSMSSPCASMRRSMIWRW